MSTGEVVKRGGELVTAGVDDARDLVERSAQRLSLLSDG
jgi:hypothetical protein